MTPLKGGPCLVLIIIGLHAIIGYPMPEDNTERSETQAEDNEAGDDGGSGNGNGSGNDEPVAEAVKLENSEQGKNKNQPSIAELFEALGDLNNGGSKGLKSLATAQAPKSDAVRQEEAMGPVKDDNEENGDDYEDEEVGSGDENYPDDKP